MPGGVDSGRALFGSRKGVEVYDVATPVESPRIPGGLGARFLRLEQRLDLLDSAIDAVRDEARANDLEARCEALSVAHQTSIQRLESALAAASEECATVSDRQKKQIVKVANSLTQLGKGLTERVEALESQMLMTTVANQSSAGEVAAQISATNVAWEARLLELTAHVERLEEQSKASGQVELEDLQARLEALEVQVEEQVLHPSEVKEDFLSKLQLIELKLEENDGDVRLQQLEELVCEQGELLSKVDQSRTATARCFSDFRLQFQQLASAVHSAISQPDLAKGASPASEKHGTLKHDSEENTGGTLRTSETRQLQPDERCGTWMEHKEPEQEDPPRTPPTRTRPAASPLSPDSPPRSQLSFVEQPNADGASTAETDKEADNPTILASGAADSREPSADAPVAGSVKVVNGARVAVGMGDSRDVAPSKVSQVARATEELTGRRAFWSPTPPMVSMPPAPSVPPPVLAGFGSAQWSMRQASSPQGRSSSSMSPSRRILVHASSQSSLPRHGAQSPVRHSIQSLGRQSVQSPGRAPVSVPVQAMAVIRVASPLRSPSAHTKAETQPGSWQFRALQGTVPARQLGRESPATRVTQRYA